MFLQEIGEMRARISQLEKAVDSMSGDLREIRDTIIKAKGGWRGLVWVVGIATFAFEMLLRLTLPLLNMVK
jgi:hypothetical protein